MTPLGSASSLSLVHFLSEWVRADKKFYKSEIFERDDVMKARLSDFWNSNRHKGEALSELGLALFRKDFKFVFILRVNFYFPTSLRLFYF